MEPAPLPLHEAISEFKRKLVLEALTRFAGNRSRAAAALKIERNSLLRLIRELELSELSGLPFRDVERCLGLVEEIRARKKR